MDVMMPFVGLAMRPLNHPMTLEKGGEIEGFKGHVFIAW